MIQLLEGESHVGQGREPWRLVVVPSFWIGEGVLNRQTHVGRADLGLNGAIIELDQRVDDTLGMHHYIYFIVRDLEKAMGLYDLHSLVHQSGGIDGDLVSHAPGGMLQRLLRGDMGQLIYGALAEGAAGCRQNQPCDAIFTPQALPYGAGLAVDGKDGCAVAARLGHQELAGGYDYFFVRQDDGLTLPNCGQRGSQPHLTHGSNHHDVHIRM